MKLKEKERLLPFSHKAGNSVLLPQSKRKIEIFPTLIKIDDLYVYLNIKGPVKDFTISLDLKKGMIIVSAFIKEGYMRYSLQKKNDTINIHLQKYPHNIPLLFTYNQTTHKIEVGSSLEILDTPSLSAAEKAYSSLEQLCLGNHKQQNWEEIRKRESLEEIIPLWLKAASWFSEIKEWPLVGNLVLLQAFKEACLSNNRLLITQSIKNLFRATFKGILFPELSDNEYLGLSPVYEEKSCPFPLLLESAHLLRSLFFQEREKSYHFLPKLLPDLVCGRYLNIVNKQNDLLNFSWSKGRLRELSIQYQTTHHKTPIFDKNLKRCRLKQHKRDKGLIVNLPLTEDLIQSKELYLDNFEA
ncbi:MAG: hypothetical protein ACOVOR_04410 [Rhabdochlamydiaceae bacterium]